MLDLLSTALCLLRFLQWGKGQQLWFFVCYGWTLPKLIPSATWHAEGKKPYIHPTRIYQKSFQHLQKIINPQHKKTNLFFLTHRHLFTLKTKTAGPAAGGLLILQGFFDARRPWGFHPPPIRWIRGFRAQLRRASLVVHGNRNAGKPPTS